MSSDEDTPTNAGVRAYYVHGRALVCAVSETRLVLEFDRWLAAHDAEIRAERIARTRRSKPMSSDNETDGERYWREHDETLTAYREILWNALTLIAPDQASGWADELTESADRIKSKNPSVPLEHIEPHIYLPGGFRLSYSEADR